MTAVFTFGVPFDSRQLDVGRDDYYAHPGTWWDVRDSTMLARLDSHAPAPPAIAGLTATSEGAVATVDWSATPPEAGIWYRVYGPDGRLLGDPQLAPTYVVAGQLGQTLQWTIRSMNDDGLFSPPATIRFKVGYGIVDANGALAQDTVAPADVTGLRAKRTGKKVVVRWNAVADPIGLRGYRVLVGGHVVTTVTGTSIALARARGRTVVVKTVDEAGNRADGVSVDVGR